MILSLRSWVSGLLRVSVLLFSAGCLKWEILLIYFFLFSIWVGSLLARLYGPAEIALVPAGVAFSVF
jgi:hypothetical protein